DNSTAEFSIDSPSLELANAIDNCSTVTIPNGSFESAGFQITRQKIGMENLIKGFIRNPLIRHFDKIDDKNIDTVYFHVFNFRQIIGEHARRHEKHIGGSSIRLLF